MRVLIVNTSEQTGGAAVAANRLMDALNNNGVKAKMLVRDKETESITVAQMPHSIFGQWHFLWERVGVSSGTCVSPSFISSTSTSPIRVTT